MCGRFTHRLSWADIVRLYRLTLDPYVGRNDIPPRYNISPTQTVPIVHNDADGNEIAEDARWWLVPWWAKEMPKAAMFNARIETVATSGAFKDAFGLTRKHAIPLLEWLDDEGVARREGQDRVAGPRAAAAAVEEEGDASDD